MLREIKNWKANQSSTSSNFEKEMLEALKKSKQETDEKLKKMYEAVEEIGLLQRRMIKENEVEVKIERPPSRMK